MNYYSTHLLRLAQEKLNFLGLVAHLEEDGIRGEKTDAAILRFQQWWNVARAKDDPARLLEDNELGPKTWAALMSEEAILRRGRTLEPVKLNTPTSSLPTGTVTFDKASEKVFNELHPKLKQLVAETRKRIPFILLDGSRGRAEQEKAFKTKHSKVHFGHSAHNWSPAIAFDFAPGQSRAAIDWDDEESFLKVIKVFMKVAKELGITIRSLSDPNMDGSPADGWDFPHIELHPWKEWAKHSHLYGE